MSHFQKYIIYIHKWLIISKIKLCVIGNYFWWWMKWWWGNTPPPSATPMFTRLHSDPWHYHDASSEHNTPQHNTNKLIECTAWMQHPHTYTMQIGCATLYICRLYSRHTPLTKKPKTYRKKFGFGTPRIDLGSVLLWGGSSQIGGVTLPLQIYDTKTDTKTDITTQKTDTFVSNLPKND